MKRTPGVLRKYSRHPPFHTPIGAFCCRLRHRSIRAQTLLYSVGACTSPYRRIRAARVLSRISLKAASAGMLGIADSSPLTSLFEYKKLQSERVYRFTDCPSGHPLAPILRCFCLDLLESPQLQFFFFSAAKFAIGPRQQIVRLPIIRVYFGRALQPSDA